ncbi:carbohydrate ABC transporter permease [Jannaschia donghaensis]|uniref:Inner membrane ABC transporter permease protein YcjP n=1 Tax=Jannaschia donghaensis TaxID=420998 RepID=A0A0M6YIV5_9RHOB|nr:carbohydrate ABC transporter permease [Jannaschia donghaensis]CTQ49443.1 Inner membrane ABC transporter permease protein YcjP [Jannaschia donghaensis]
MSRFGNIFWLCLLFGTLWGAVLTTLLTLLALFVSGEPFQPQVTAGALAGLIAAGVLTGVSPARRTLGVRALATFVFLLVLTLASGTTPLGLPLSVYPIGQVTFTVLAALAAVQAIQLTARGFGPMRERRYNVEVICLRFVKGFGLLAFTIAVALPFFVMVMMSLKNQQLLLSNPLDFSIDFGQGASALFRSYIELFTQYHFGTYLLNSALVSVATVAITLFFAVPGAYAVARLRFPGQNFLSRSILLIYMVPMIVLVIPLYAIFSQLGMRNTLWGLMLVYPATTIPVALYMLQGYFRGIPSELEEAGLMDGLSRLKVIIKITLPLALPALASVALYVFMIAWNEFLFAFMFLDNVDLYTLSRGIAELNSSEVPRQHLMAGAVIATVPVLALFLWFERFLVAGLTAGSVKG